MFKREIRINFRPWLVWTAVLLGFYISVVAVYPLILNGNEKTIDAMMATFSEDVLKAFNMDLASISSPAGWIKSEGMMFDLLVGGLFAAMTGAGILLREESDKTIEFLAAKPVGRARIVTVKAVSGLLYVTLFDLAVAAGILVSLFLSDDLDAVPMLEMLLTPLAAFWALFSAALFLSTFCHSVKSVLGIGFALVFTSYFLSLLGSMSEKLEFLKYFSVFTACETRRILEQGAVNWPALGIVTALAAGFLALTYARYQRKEFRL